MMNLKSGEQIDQPFLHSSNEDEKSKFFEKFEEEAIVGIPMELEKGPMTLEDKWPKEVSLIEKPIEKYHDEVVQDALMRDFDDINDDGVSKFKGSITYD